MPRRYEIPPNDKEDEKPIGGVLTFVQFFWLLGGAIIGVFVYLGLFAVTRIQIISIIPGLACCLIGLPFAFYKKYNMPYAKYLLTKKKFDKKTKKLINRRNVKC